MHLQLSDIERERRCVCGSRPLSEWGFSAESMGCDINPYDDERHRHLLRILYLPYLSGEIALLETHATQTTKYHHRLRLSQNRTKTLLYVLCLCKMIGFLYGLCFSMLGVFRRIKCALAPFSVW